MKPLLFPLIIIFLTVGNTACGNKVPLSLPSESEISLNSHGRI
jgi:predicted small lipoprotein YifL